MPGSFPQIVQSRAKRSGPMFRCFAYNCFAGDGFIEVDILPRFLNCYEMDFLRRDCQRVISHQNTPHNLVGPAPFVS